MQLIQSYIFSVGRVKLSLYEQRILLRVVEYAQESAKKGLVKDKMMSTNEYDNVCIRVLISEILEAGSHHYELIYDAVKSLEGRIMEFWDSNTNTFVCTPLCYNAEMRAGSGIIRFYVARRVFDAILDFTKGFSKYDYSVVMSLPSPYAMRFYMLFCNQRRAIEYKIDFLKKMFGVEDRYINNGDFIKRVVAPSAKILEERHVNGFTFVPVRCGRKYDKILFKPIKRQEATKEELISKLSLSILLPRQLTLLLMHEAGFSSRELSAHKVMLSDFAKIDDCLSVCLDIVNRARKHNRAKGWIINALKYECADKRVK